MKWNWTSYGVLIGSLFCAGIIVGYVAFAPSNAKSVVATSDASAWSNPLQPAYIGSDACADCHGEQAAAHAKSGHSQTFFSDNLSQRFSKLFESSVHDPERADNLKYVAEGDTLLATIEFDHRQTKLPIQFAIGSGRHATTFVNLLDLEPGRPIVLEHRFSLFENGHSAGLTPSHAGLPVRDSIDGLGKLHRDIEAVGCISCHSTTGTIHGRAIDDLRQNVGCERCHGPGRTHAAAKLDNRDEASMRFKKGSTTALQEIQMCGQCHRLPEMLSAPASKSDPKLVRFQPVGLLNSNCYLRSEERIRCSTCHDPHQTVSRDTESYNVTCRNCHSQPDKGHALCPKSPRESCIDCHMPAVEIHPGISFHDHWIRVRASTDKSP